MILWLPKNTEKLIKLTMENELDMGMGNGTYVSEKSIPMDGFQDDRVDNFEIGTGFDWIDNLYEKCKIIFQD